MYLSIIIPVYNVEQYLRECIDSILCQIDNHLDEIEILLIDDGSTDTSGKICDEYVEKNKGLVKVFHKKNEGLLLTRRYGFKKASGTYIMNIDSDDFIEPNAVHTIIKTAKQTNADVIIFNTYLYDNEKKVVWYQNVFGKKDCQLSKQQVIKEFLVNHTVNSVCVKIFKKDCINLVKDYTGYSCYGEDSLQTVELLERAESFYYLNRILYDYRCGSGMTYKFYCDYYLDYQRICKIIKESSELRIIDDYDQCLSVRFFSMVGRAITQSRWAIPFTLKKNKMYLMSIRNDCFYRTMMEYFSDIKSQLQFDHRLLIYLLNNKQYVKIYILLWIKQRILDR